MKLEPLKTLVVGIDAGTVTGCGIYNREKQKIVFSGSSDFHRVQELLVNSFPDPIERKAAVKVYVEKPKTMLYKRNESSIRNEELTIMYHAGGNRREAILLAESLRRKGFDVEEVDPVREPKWNQRRFELFTGSKKRTNEHERDAVRLAVYYANHRPNFR